MANVLHRVLRPEKAVASHQKKLADAAGAEGDELHVPCMELTPDRRGGWMASGDADGGSAGTGLGVSPHRLQGFHVQTGEVPFFPRLSIP